MVDKIVLKFLCFERGKMLNATREKYGNVYKTFKPRLDSKENADISTMKILVDTFEKAITLKFKEWSAEGGKY